MTVIIMSIIMIIIMILIITVVMAGIIITDMICVRVTAITVVRVTAITVMAANIFTPCRDHARNEDGPGTQRDMSHRAHAPVHASAHRALSPLCIARRAFENSRNFTSTAARFRADFRLADAQSTALEDRRHPTVSCRW